MATIITVNGKDIAIIIETEEASNYVTSQIEKLQKKIESLQGLGADEQAEEAVKSLLPRLKKIEAENLLNEYTYAELKARAKGESLGAFLKENGIAETLIGSAERGYKQAVASISALKAAGITDDKVLESSLRVALNAGRSKEWTELVIQFALENN